MSGGERSASVDDAVRLFLAAVSDLDGVCSEEGRHNAERDILVSAPAVAAFLVAAEARAEALERLR